MAVWDRELNHRCSSSSSHGWIKRENIPSWIKRAPRWQNCIHNRCCLTLWITNRRQCISERASLIHILINQGSNSRWLIRCHDNIEKVVPCQTIIIQLHSEIIGTYRTKRRCHIEVIPARTLPTSPTHVLKGDDIAWLIFRIINSWHPNLNECSLCYILSRDSCCESSHYICWRWRWRRRRRRDCRRIYLQREWVGVVKCSICDLKCHCIGVFLTTNRWESVCARRSCERAKWWSWLLYERAGTAFWVSAGG